MTPTPTLSVGTYLVDSDTVYVITKVDQDRIFYSPANAGGDHPSVTGSVPIANVFSSGFRFLCTKQDINQFFNDLIKTKPSLEPIDSKTYKDLRGLNNPIQIVPLLRQLWATKNIPNTAFLGNSRDTFENILNHLAQEFSMVLHQSPETLRKKIISCLSQK